MTLSDAILVALIPIFLILIISVYSLYTRNKELSSGIGGSKYESLSAEHLAMMDLLSKIINSQQELINSTVSKTVSIVTTPPAPQLQTNETIRATEYAQHLADLKDWTDNLLPPDREDTHMLAVTDDGTLVNEDGTLMEGPVDLPDDMKRRIFGLG